MMEYHAPKQPVKGLLTPLSAPLTACQEHGDEQLSGNAKEYADEIGIVAPVSRNGHSVLSEFAQYNASAAINHLTQIRN